MTDWVKICKTEGAQPVEIETEEDGTILLESVVAHFPGTTTIKYKSPSGTGYRGVKLKDGVINPPNGGWEASPLYIAVNPAAEEQAEKRKASAEPESFTGVAAKRVAYEDDPNCGDMILLGMKPTTTEEQIKDYFKDKCDLAMVQMKKSKDGNSGYAFIKFCNKEEERTIMRQHHQIDGRECRIKVPDSRAQQGERRERKVYVGYHNESLTQDEMRQHFEQFGEVEEVYVPTPWRHFAFVTFASASVAQSLIGKEHNVRGIGLVIRPKQLKGQDNDNKQGMHGGMGMPPGMHGMEPGMWGPHSGWGGPNPNPGNADHWAMYNKMMQGMAPYGGPGGPPLPTGPAPPSGYKSYNKPTSPPGSYSWGDQSGEYDYGSQKAGGYGAGPKSYGSGPKY